MKKIALVLLFVFMLTSCNGWFFQPSPYNPPTPFLPVTNTPSIVSPTPVVIGAVSATPIIASPVTILTNTPLDPFTNTPVSFITDTPIPTNTNAVTNPMPSISVEVLGCNTSIDITHGMGEVTNAYITLKNNGNVDLTNLQVTLKARDEGREHPDKTLEITSLPVGFQVNLKLTVDSTYKEETPIQIEVSDDAGLFQRVGADACRDIGLFAPNPDALNTPVTVNP